MSYSASRLKALDTRALDQFIREHLEANDVATSTTQSLPRVIGTTALVKEVCGATVGRADDISICFDRLISHLPARAATWLSDCATRGEPVNRFGRPARPWLWSKSNGVIWPNAAGADKFAERAKAIGLAARVDRLEARVAELEKLVASLAPASYPPIPFIDPLGAK